MGFIKEIRAVGRNRNCKNWLNKLVLTKFRFINIFGNDGKMIIKRINWRKSVKIRLARR